MVGKSWLGQVMVGTSNYRLVRIVGSCGRVPRCGQRFSFAVEFVRKIHEELVQPVSVQLLPSSLVFRCYEHNLS